MMTIEEMNRIRENAGLTIAQIAEKSGVPVGTLGKIFSGYTKRPRTATMRALERALTNETFIRSGKAAKYGDTAIDLSGVRYHYFDTDKTSETGHDQPVYWEISEENGKGSFLVREAPDPDGPQYPPVAKRVELSEVEGTAARWKRQGEYTVDDYLALPDDIRVELIDGVFFYMEAPTTMHQIIVGELMAALLLFIRKNNGLCRVIPSPVDVQLDNDGRTMVQPDLVVICDRDKIRRKIHGAPDLVVEITSPSSSSKDRRIKMQKYAYAGVREYWIVDPYKKKVIVYDFEHDDDVFIYGFEEKVPVRIWDGKCEVDFQEIYEQIRDLYF